MIRRECYYGYLKEPEDMTSLRCDNCKEVYGRDEFIPELYLCRACAQQMESEAQASLLELEDLMETAGLYPDRESVLAAYRRMFDILLAIKREYWDKGYFPDHLEPERIDELLCALYDAGRASCELHAPGPRHLPRH